MKNHSMALIARASLVSNPGRWVSLLVSLFSGLWFMTAAPALATDADLDTLRQSLETKSVETRALVGEAAALFLAIADLPDDWLTSHEHAVTRLSQILRIAGNVASDSGALATFITSDEPKAPVTEEMLEARLGAYQEIEGGLERSTSNLREQIRSISKQADIAAPVVPWPALMAEADRYVDDANRFLLAIKGVDQVMSLTTREGERERSIKLNLFEFIDDKWGKNTPYGLYTHVLFLNRAERNRAFLDALRASTPRAGDVPAEDALLINLFAIPVQSRVRARMAWEIGADEASPVDAGIYDYEGVNNLIRKICLSDEITVPDFCAGETGGGPFLVTHEHWLMGADQISPPLLVVDLSNVHPDAFGEFIRAVKQQIMLPDFSSGERIASLRLQLLTIVLDLAYWLDPINKSVAAIVSLGGKK